MKKVTLHKFVFSISLIVLGMAVWAVIPPRNEAQGEVRATPQPQSFQTGGQLSVPVLREIAATLRQIDSRLARLETVAQKLQASRSADGKVNN
jgi:hypothetical protein